MGGFKELIISVKGEAVFSQLKFEAGVHRVQRVPDTEASGRIHTSAATVAVLPEVEDVEVNPITKVGSSSIKVWSFRWSIRPNQA